MCGAYRSLSALAAVFLCLSLGGTASAALVRFHYVPIDGCGNTAFRPAGPCGAPGELVRWLGAVREPSIDQPRPTHVVTFWHPYTGRRIAVPLAFPEGTPRLEHRPAQIVYNYGSYAVEVHFLPDGSVDVVYNAGFLRLP